MKFPLLNGVSWASRRWSLWALLLALVVTLLAILVWLSGRYESSMVQSRLEHDAGETVTDIRSGLTRNIQTFQALQSTERPPAAWHAPAAELLREHREIMRLEWRSETLEVLGFVETPYRSSVFERLGRHGMEADVNLTCTTARRLSGSAYSTSYFMPQNDGLGLEVMDMCLPIVAAGRLMGYVVATYSLQDILGELVGKQLARGVGLSFTEADGTRLALHGVVSRGSRVYVAQQLLDLPGNTLVVRMESRLGTPALFPNVLTALVTAMSVALLAVLFLLARDMRRRLKVEHDLGEALAFRKAMEDSVLTGLRARDLQGRITYVNPAFCKMVGVDAKDLLNQSVPAPYWPPELAAMYQQRQEIRLSGSNLPREGHESVFMRQDGTRFPVLIMEAPLINAVGKHTGWMSAILDVSEQRRIEELSRASQDRLQATARLAMVGEMASLLSHELNQPLAAISSYATGSLNLLQGEMAPAATSSPGGPDAGPTAPPLSEDLQLAMRRIAEQAERAGKVIKSVHDFVRRRDQVREAVEPRALLDAIMPLVSLQARKLGVRVVIEVDAACEPVLCDRTMVEQVLLNLSRNGMQAMQAMQGIDETQAPNQQARVLTLRIRPAASNAHSRWVEFAVIDRGEGIPREVADQLFTPFFTTKEEGMGLGLSLCRTVIEQHGGFLGFEAAQPRGTIFSFTLPVALARDGHADVDAAGTAKEMA
ncbi:two-component system sensor histidine kinase NtrB [Polaromonas sp. JS666]|uniref:two-component system sensor histidine kinase NtrB n=1 Tax=Polaromonas sp. (strain JS666 / ATCC BAA-500) TaxID=296591 RepID=UPI0000537D2E|nr:ATP-binding protein [Polaromonas sp. JS666]ABE46536.1 signal transduction histidine kinase, nitrogen specific, NtrB [Polaromonas sp. JS666]